MSEGVSELRQRLQGSSGGSDITSGRVTNSHFVGYG